MKTRTRNALGMIVIGGAAAFGMAMLARKSPPPSHRKQDALDAIPERTLVVATADLGALRASPVGAPFLREGREIKGLGKVKDVCGFDPIDTLDDFAFAVPRDDEAGNFGLAATGKVDAQAILDCASKVIKARGGSPIVTTLGSFRTVRDASLEQTGGGEIAVRPGGPLLLGQGAYLRAMIDAADGKIATVRSNVAHAGVSTDLGAATARVTVELTPEQRRSLEDELRESGSMDSPARAIVAGGAALRIGDEVTITGVIECNDANACAALARSLDERRAARAKEYGLAMVGFGQVLEQMKIDAHDLTLVARVSLPADHAAILVDRLMKLGGFSHPMPDDAAALKRPPERPPEPPPSASAVPDEVIRAKRDAGR